MWRPRSASTESAGSPYRPRLYRQGAKFVDLLLDSRLQRQVKAFLVSLQTEFGVIVVVLGQLHSVVNPDHLHVAAKMNDIARLVAEQVARTVFVGLDDDVAQHPDIHDSTATVITDNVVAGIGAEETTVGCDLVLQFGTPGEGRAE